MESNTIEEQVASCCAHFEVNGQRVAIRLEADEQAVTLCRPLPLDSEEAKQPPTADVTNPHLLKAIEQLREYFAGTRKRFSVEIAFPVVSPFQAEVWLTAQEIPYGQTRSYWWMAVHVGNPYASRAVGNTLGANRLAIFVPCHRVVRQDGTIGGFTGGSGWKKLLLEHEERHKDNGLDVEEPVDGKKRRRRKKA